MAFRQSAAQDREYDYNGRFSTNNDVVHILTNCIAVLEGNSHFVTRTQALRYIIHLAGDIHQPLHVGCGYYEPDGTGSVRLLKNASTITNVNAHDVGGNILTWVVTNSVGHLATNELHAYWDNDMVSIIDTNHGNANMTKILTNAISLNRTKWKSKGDYHKWPALWASDSVKESRGVYEGVTFGPATFKAHNVPKEIHITLEPDYDTNQQDRATRQVAKAALRLADLLNRIHWQ